MPIKTDRIKFNLTDRGYKAHGTPRNFNVPLIVGAINSAACQERVASRSMLGYYGHWPRIKFGHLTTVEGGLEGGKPAIVEPAIVTTYLHAHPDGTVEHESEFLDTESGKVAARMHQSRVGGFSSVIDHGKAVFTGFDYVAEPNFRANRGYSLDSAGGELTYDDAMGLPLEDIDACIRDEHLRAMAIVLDSANAATSQCAAVMEAMQKRFSELEAEREQLLSMLARDNPAQAAVFDAAGAPDGQRPTILDTSSAQELRRLAATFDSAQLQVYQGALTDGNFKPPTLADRVRDVLFGGR